MSLPAGSTCGSNVRWRSSCATSMASGCQPLLANSLANRSMLAWSSGIATSSCGCR